MLIAHYIGPAKPGLRSAIGWHLTVWAQKGPYDKCTHTEAIHEVHADGTVTIASSSIVDKGVRVKERVKLNLPHWVITDVPAWDVRESVRWFDQAIADGLKYDMRGALATVLPGRHDGDKVFCTEAVFAPFMQAPHYYTPAMGLALCLTIGKQLEI